MPGAALLVLLGIALATPGLALVASALIAGQRLTQGLLDYPLLPGVVLGGAGLLLFTTGVTVHVFGPLRKPHAAGTRAGSYGTILGSLYLSVVVSNVATVCYLAVSALMGIPTRAIGLLSPGAESGDITYLIVAALSQELALLGILYARIVRPGVVTWQGMGLNGKDLSRRVLIGLLTAICILVIIGLIEYLLSLAGIRQTQADLFAPIRHASPLHFALMFLAASILAGLVEECFFRGYVFRLLLQRRGAFHAYLASATIFAAAHLSWQAFLPFLLAGLVLAFVFHRSGSLVPAIVAHMLNNGIGLAVLYFAMA